MKIASILLLFCSLSGRTFEDPDAAKWLKMLSMATYQTPYAVDLTLDISLSRASQKETTINMKGVLTYADPTHLNLKVTAHLNTAGMTVVSEILMVGDGELLWMEQKLPDMAQPVVTKVPISRQGQLSGMDPFNWTPRRMLELIAAHLDLKYDGIEAGKVRLSALISEGYAGMFALGDPGELDLAQSSFVLEMDGSDGYPLVITAKIGESLSLKVEASALRYPKAEVVAELCRYTPEQGITVLDHTAAKRRNHQ